MLACEQLYRAILNSYHDNRPLIRENTSKDSNWWNNIRTRLKKTTCKLHNKAERPEEWENYSTILTESNKHTRNTKSESWRKFWAEVESTIQVAHLHKILAKDAVNPVGIPKLGVKLWKFFTKHIT